MYTFTLVIKITLRNNLIQIFSITKEDAKNFYARHFIHFCCFADYLFAYAAAPPLLIIFNQLLTQVLFFFLQHLFSNHAPGCMNIFLMLTNSESGIYRAFHMTPQKNTHGVRSSKRMAHSREFLSLTHPYKKLVFRISLTLLAE